MTLPMPSPEELHALLDDALIPLSEKEAEKLCPVLYDLFESVLTRNELLNEDIDNPVTHHTTVLKHMMEIAKGEGLEILPAAAIALLHDNWPAKKITREMRDAAKTETEKDLLEALNLEYRSEHMKCGSKNAAKRLRELNEKRHEVVFSEEEIYSICGIIAIHDDPSIDKPIVRDNRMAVAFREADRLWMQAPAGVRADLARKKKNSPTPQDCLTQANNNLTSFRKERSLYPVGETFQDQDTFFRTETGFTIFKRYRLYWDNFAKQCIHTNSGSA